MLPSAKKSKTLLSLLALCCLALNACGDAAANGGNAEVVASSSDPASEEAQTLYLRVMDQIYGTPKQQEAATHNQWDYIQGQATDCMSKSGKTYVPAPYVSARRSDNHGHPSNIMGFIPADPTFGIKSRIERYAKVDRTGIPPNVNPANIETYTRALQACKFDEGHSYPETLFALSDAVVTTMAGVQDREMPTLEKDYAVCLHDRGFKASNYSGLFDEVNDAYPKMPDTKFEPEKLPGWDDAVSLEKRAGQADVDCRKNRIAPLIQAAMPDLQQFANQHKAELEANEAEWEKLASPEQ